MSVPGPKRRTVEVGTRRKEGPAGRRKTAKVGPVGVMVAAVPVGLPVGGVEVPLPLPGVIPAPALVIPVTGPTP